MTPALSLLREFGLVATELTGEQRERLGVPTSYFASSNDVEKAELGSIEEPWKPRRRAYLKAVGRCEGEQAQRSVCQTGQVAAKRFRPARRVDVRRCA